MLAGHLGEPRFELRLPLSERLFDGVPLLADVGQFRVRPGQVGRRLGGGLEFLNASRETALALKMAFLERQIIALLCLDLALQTIQQALLVGGVFGEGGEELGEFVFLDLGPCLGLGVLRFLFGNLGREPLGLLRRIGAFRELLNLFLEFLFPGPAFHLAGLHGLSAGLHVLLGLLEFLGGGLVALGKLGDELRQVGLLLKAHLVLFLVTLLPLALRHGGADERGGGRRRDRRGGRRRLGLERDGGGWLDGGRRRGRRHGGPWRGLNRGPGRRRWDCGAGRCGGNGGLGHGRRHGGPWRRLDRGRGRRRGRRGLWRGRLGRLFFARLQQGADR